MTRISPNLAFYLKNRLAIRSTLRLDFYNRMENLCELSGGGMSPELHREIESVFGLPFTNIVEHYDTFSQPNLPEKVTDKIRRLIPSAYYLEFVNLFTRPCPSQCLQPCLTITTLDDLPDPSVCDFVKAVIDDGGGGLSIAFFQYIGDEWVVVIGILLSYENGAFTNIGYGIKSPWALKVGDDYYEGSGDIPLDPAVESIDNISFVSGICEYALGEIVVPIPCIYSSETIWVDEGNGANIINVDTSEVVATISYPLPSGALELQASFPAINIGLETNAVGGSLQTVIWHNSTTPLNLSLEVIGGETHNIEFTEDCEVGLPDNCYQLVYTATDGIENLMVVDITVLGTSVIPVSAPYNDQNVIDTIQGFISQQGTVEIRVTDQTVTFTLSGVYAGFGITSITFGDGVATPTVAFEEIVCP